MLNVFGGVTLNDMETVTNTTTALNQLLEPLSRTLGVEAARSLSGLQIDPEIQARIEELADLCNDGLLTEAQFNWDVAEDLVPRLEHLGATVVMTRHSNDGVGPCVDERAEIANHAHAAVALSIHADGNEAEGAHGFDVIHPAKAEMVSPSLAERSKKLAESVRDSLVDAGVPLALVASDGVSGPAYLVTSNFAVIMKWNRSTYFATSVGLLADRIAGG